MTDKSVVFQGELSRLLVDVAGKLAVFLERVLPQLSDDWWQETVLNNLSISQKRQIDQRNITTLNGLDTAGLLKVLDQNWYEISSQMGFTREDRNFVKETAVTLWKFRQATMNHLQAVPTAPVRERRFSYYPPPILCPALRFSANS